MANTYKKPETKIVKVESQQIMAGSLNKGTDGVSDPTQVLSRENSFDFFAFEEEEETPGKSDDDDSWEDWEEEEEF